MGRAGNGSFNNGGWEILDWDISKGDTVNDFFKLKMDVSVLCFNSGGVLKLGA